MLISAVVLFILLQFAVQDDDARDEESPEDDGECAQIRLFDPRPRHCCDPAERMHVDLKVDRRTCAAQSSSALKVSPCRMSPVCKPLRNQRTR